MNQELNSNPCPPDDEEVPQPENDPNQLVQFPLVIPRSVADRLMLGALELGLNLDVFCQVILGRASRGTEWISAPIRTKSIFDQLPENFMEEVPKLLRMFSMSSQGGSATCPHCTQRLSPESIQFGVCQQCQGEL